MGNIRVRMVLFKGKTHADGTHPIQLQYYVDGKSKRKTIATCMADDWDDKSKRLRPKARNAATINYYLTEKFAEAERIMYAVRLGDIDKDQVFIEQKDITLSEAFDCEIERYKSGNMASAYTRISSNKTVLAGSININISLKQIDLQWFQNLYTALQSKGHAGSTDAKTIKTVRSIVSRYIKGPLAEDIRRFRVPAQKSVKQKLTNREFQAIEDLDLEHGTLLAAVRDIFVLQVYLRGIRIGDILQARCDAFKEGRFTYQADKTGKDYTIALIDKAQVIVDRYRSDREYLFPLFRWVNDPKISQFDNELNRNLERKSCTTIVNKHLKEIAILAGITKPLSSHIARHTFARMAIDKINNPMVTMELLGHASLAVHQAYLNDIRKDDVLDAAADDIFG
jgi:integrase/recombinase XerD